MPFGTIAKMGLGILGNALDPSKEQHLIGGHTSSGNASDIRPVDTEPDGPKTFLEKTNSILGRDVRRVATDAAGGFLSDFRARRNSRNRFKDLKAEGLTPHEIAGGGAGAPVQSQGNTLGNGPAEQAQGQLEFQKEENEKDRQLQRDIEEIRHGDRREQLDINRALAIAETGLKGEQQLQVRNNIKLIHEQTQKARLELDHYFPILFAKMGPENLMVALASFFANVDTKDVLTMTGDRSPETMRAIEKLYSDLRSRDSIFNREAKGLTNLLGRDQDVYLRSGERRNFLGERR